jgi:rhodanese-related sulfurtransferase/glyoxylase-like metal-dependent hydrolase (beta-lactamase superfamily II)
VVDPRRDVAEYLDDAAAAGLRMEYVIETHVHADFLSGHLELAAATGATVIYGAGADVGFPHREVTDGERLDLGEVVLEFRATPGHTPESISVVVWEDPRAAVPYGVLTGDTLFIGDVGRPDLLASQGRSPEEMARQLHRSVHTRLLTLPDGTRVFPAHGAGSACGKNLSTETVSTIGEQRRTNYALQLASAEEFTAAITEGQPPWPGYFAHVAELNREPHQLLLAGPPPALSLDEVLGRQGDGAAVLDVRSPEEFARGHLRGSLNAGLDGRFAEHAGEVIGDGQEIVVVCDPGRAVEARVRLARVGLDTVTGVLGQPAEAFSARPDVVDVASRVTARQLAEARSRIPGLVVLDVRGPGERRLGYVEGSVHIPLAELRGRADELDPARPVVAYCAGGYRSSIAASLLRARGFADVSGLIGGYQAWAAILKPFPERLGMAAHSAREPHPVAGARPGAQPSRSLGRSSCSRSQGSSSSTASAACPLVLRKLITSRRVSRSPACSAAASARSMRRRSSWASPAAPATAAAKVRAVSEFAPWPRESPASISRAASASRSGEPSRCRAATIQPATGAPSYCSPSDPASTSAGVSGS